MLASLGWRYRAFRNRGRIRIPAAALDTPPLPAESLVIPAIGAAYAEEGALAARFAERFCPELREIVLVSDLDRAAFPALPAKARVATLDVSALMPRSHAYSALFRSRLIKVQAPLQARHGRIVVTDSDLLLLRPFALPFADGCLMGSFRSGRMVSKVRQSGAPAPAELAGTWRPYLAEHLNSAFLAATRATWERLVPAWLAAFTGVWRKLPDNQPPTDQLPLACVLDHLRLTTVDLGDWVNWPVSKQIGGKAASVPPQVIGAHGGFPPSEWLRYLDDPGCALSFIDQAATRRLRYLRDDEKA